MDEITNNAIKLETPASEPEAKVEAAEKPKKAPKKPVVKAKKAPAKKKEKKPAAKAKKVKDAVKKPAAKRVAGMKAQGQVPKDAFAAMLKHCKAKEIKAADYVRDAVLAQLKRDKLFEPKA